MQQISDQATAKNVVMMDAKIASWALVVLFSILTGCVDAPPAAQVESSTPQTVVVTHAMKALGSNHVQRGLMLAEAECAKYGLHVVSSKPCAKLICYKGRVYYECGDQCLSSDRACDPTPLNAIEPVNTTTEGPSR
jgi:hypothetical protein